MIKMIYVSAKWYCNIINIYTLWLYDYDDYIIDDDDDPQPIIYYY